MIDHHPDWARVGARAPDSYAALGDPTRWGASVTLNTLPIVQPLQQGGVTQSEQILSAQCRDGYSRAWTLSGTLSAPADLHAAPDGGNFGEWAVAAQVTQGVGQNQVVQLFNLRAIVAADDPYYWNSDPSDPFFFLGTGEISRPFIIPGGLIGNSINVCIIQSFRNNLLNIPAIPIKLTMILCPFDPGARK